MSMIIIETEQKSAEEGSCSLISKSIIALEAKGTHVRISI